MTPMIRKGIEDMFADEETSPPVRPFAYFAQFCVRVPDLSDWLSSPKCDAFLSRRLVFCHDLKRCSIGEVAFPGVRLIRT